MDDHTIGLNSITITRIIHPDGQLGFQFSHTPDKISFIETLGMLSAAQWHLYHQMTETYGGQ